MNNTYSNVKEHPNEELFALKMPKEAAGIFRGNWNPDEIDHVEVVCKRCDSVKSGTMAVVSLDKETQWRLVRLHNTNGHILLEDLRDRNSPVDPDCLIALGEEEAKNRLEILGEVVRFSFHLVD